MTTRSPGDRLLVCGVLLGVYLLGALLFAWSTPFPTEFDEFAHLSYVAEMSERPALLADHPNMRLLEPTDLSEWSSRQNYLSHPTA